MTIPVTLGGVPAPMGEPIVDPKTGMLTKSWADYFVRLPLTLGTSDSRLDTAESDIDTLQANDLKVLTKEDGTSVASRYLNLQNSPIELWDLYAETSDTTLLSVRSRPKTLIQSSGTEIGRAEILNFDSLRVTLDGVPASLATDLVAYWPLDDPNGSAQDTSGNGLHGVRTNAVTLSDDASVFNGPGYTIFLTDSAPAMGTNDGVTISFKVWIDPTFGTSYAPGLVVRDVTTLLSGGSDIAVFINPLTGNIRVDVDSFDASPLQVATSSAPSTSAWHDVLVWWTAADEKLRISVDGGAADVSAGTKAFPSVTTPWTIGGWTDRACYFTGKMKRVGIWDRLLTAAEIAALPSMRYPFQRVNVALGSSVVALTAQSAAISATDLTDGAYAAGLYRVTYYARITQVDTTGSSLTVTFDWTDGSVAQTYSGAAMTGNTTATYQTGSLLIRSDASSAIEYSTAYSSTDATPMEYSLDIVLERVYIG